MIPKCMFLSKTLWVNAITLVVGVLLLVTQQEWLPDHLEPILLMVVGALNMVLRFLTNQPIEPPAAFRKLQGK